MPAYRKRRIYFIEPGFQLRFITRTFLFILVGSLITAGTVFYTGWTQLGERLAAVYPQGHLVSIFYKVNLQLVINLLLAIPILLYISMRISHRIAGPIYRIKQDLAQISKGHLDKQISLRKNDELQDVAQSINQMLAGFQAATLEKRKELESVEQKLMELEMESSNGGISASLLKDRLTLVLAQLAKIKGVL